MHLLVNGFKDSLEDISQASREEQDIYYKYKDHQEVLRYEQLMHQVCIDVPVYGARFLQSVNQGGGQSALKFLPVVHEAESYKPFKVKDAQQLLQA
jgi:hypothetical protein